MPEAVAAALWEVGTAWATEAAIFVASNATIISQAAFVVGSVTYGKYQQRKAIQRGMASYRASLKDREVTIRSAIAPRRYIYGKDRVGGQLVYAEVTGTKKEFLHLVLALAAHECQSIEEIWFGDVVLPSPDGSGFIQSGEFYKGTSVYASDTLAVSGGTATLAQAASRVVGVTYQLPSDGGWGTATGWSHTAGSTSITGISLPGGVTNVEVEYEYTEGKALVRVKKHLGQAGQTADADLVAESDGKWTTVHKGTGICYLYVRLEWDKDIFGSIGIPEIKCVVKGRKVLDTRTSATGWTDNAALICADWLKRAEGMGATSAQVPSAEVTSAANICDEEIDLNVSGSETQLRYTFNGSFTTDMSPRDVLEDITQTMAGSCVWVQGRWLVRPGAYRTPEPALVPADLAGSGITIIPKASRGELFNAVRVVYRDPDQDWAEVQAPLVTNAMYETEDGGVRRVRTIQVASSMDHWRAQRLGKIELERGRQALSVQFTTSMRGYDLLPTDNVPLQFSRYGWDGGGGKVFEVTKRTYQSDGTIAYDARETAAAIYDWAYGEATVVDLAPDTALRNPYIPPEMLLIDSVESGTAHLLLQADGTIVTRAFVEWTQSTDGFVLQGGHLELQWHEAGSSQWMTMPNIPGDAVSAYVMPVADGTVVMFRLRQVNAIGRASEWSYKGHAVVGKSEPPSDVTNLQVSVTNGIGQITCDPCPDHDYAQTEFRVNDLSWGSNAVAPLQRAKSTKWMDIVTTPGTYTVCAKHFDTSGNQSTNAVCETITITEEDLAGGGASLSVLTLTPPSATLSIDQNGVVTDWTPAQTDLTVADTAGVDETASWTYSIVTAHNVVAALSGTNNNHLTVTAWTPDAAGAAWGNTVLQLSFDNDSFADVSQYHRSPTDVDGVTYVTGAFGKGASFAGASASANRGYFEGHSSFISSAPGGQWSLRCRVKFTTLPAFGTNGFYILGNAYRSIRLSPNASSQHRFEAQWVQNSGGGTLAAYQTYTTLSTGVWYLVEASYGSDGHLRLFVNGVLAGITSSAVTGAFDYIITSGDAYNRTDAIVIGAGAAGGSTGLDGVIDDLRYVVGPGGNNSAYTPETYPLPIGAYATQGYVDVLAEHATKPDLTARFPISTVVVAAATVSSGIGPSSITLQADWQGVVSSFSGASAVLSIMVNGTEQADLWTITSVTSHASITFSKSGRTVTLTGFPSSETTGYIDFFASYTGRPSQVIRLAISKVNAAQPIVIATPPAAYYIAGSTDGSVPAASLPVSRAFAAAAGSTDVTSSYTWSAVASSGITIDQPTANGPTFRVTAMNSATDVGTITATGTRAGYPNLTAVASVVKTKNLPVVGLQTSTRWTAQTVAATVASGTATAGVRLADDGGIQTTVDGTTWTDYAPWYYPITSGIGASGSYVVTALLSGAALDGGSSATGSQLALSSTRTWTKSRSTSGFEESVLTIIVGDTAAPNRFVWQVNLKVNVA